MAAVNPLETCQSTSPADPAKLCDINKINYWHIVPYKTSITFRRDVFHLCLFTISPDNVLKKKVIGGLQSYLIGLKLYFLKNLGVLANAR